MSQLDLRTAQVRIARPTRNIGEALRFYHDALGLEVVSTFEGHDGYDGVILSIPGTHVHIELTFHGSEDLTVAPSRDALLVLYVPDAAAVRFIEGRLEARGFPRVVPQNPFWARHGSTFEDTEGWRVVLVANSGLDPRQERTA